MAKSKSIQANCEWIREITPKVGSLILISAWPVEVALTSCDDWDRAEFRAKSPRNEVDFAVNVEITGRTIQYTTETGYAEPAIKVRVTFPGDGDADDSSFPGWLAVDSANSFFRRVRA